jgi:choline dehydrogenase-like flavoprotein
VSDPVDRIALDGRRSVGVVTASGIEHAADHVVVCCGAIGTPTLLLRSGIDTPGVGAGLQDHPAITIALELRPEAVDPSAPAITAASDDSDSQILAINHLSGTPGLGALVGAVMRVVGVGSVTLPEPSGRPVVTLSQFSDPADLDRMVDVARATRRLAEHPEFTAISKAAFVDEIGTTVDRMPDGDGALRDWLVEHCGGLHHVAASCRIGVVTDAAGALIGYDGIRLCDASLFPGVPTVNPYLSVITLAERLVAQWRDRPVS